MYDTSQNDQSCADGSPGGTVGAMTRGGGVPLVDIGREYIRLQIQRLGLTDKDFGIRVGISASTLSDILKGKRRPHFDHLQTIIQALDIPPSSMFKVMMDIAKEIETGGTNYAALPGRGRGYVLAEQKEAVRHALKGLRKPFMKDSKKTTED